MHPKYTRPEMERLWEERAKFEIWLKIEITVLEALASAGEIPPYISDCIEKYAKADVARIEEIDKMIDHDMNAFLRAIKESITVGMLADRFSQQEIDEVLSYLHAGLTSYDIEDTALAFRLSISKIFISLDINGLKKALMSAAIQYKHTPQIGRTHLQHAEPITFGLKLLNWYNSMAIHSDYLERNYHLWQVGKISGAVGTNSHLGPDVENFVGRNFDIYMARASSQIVSREGIAYLMAGLANIATSLAKFARDIEHLSSSEVREVFETHASGKTGSSAMPHKSLQEFANPNKCERIASLAKLVRANAHIAMENIDIRHEQDLTQSASERVIIAGSLVLLDYIIALFTRIIKEMYVDETRMLQNIYSSGGVIFSQHVTKALMDKGMPREEARDLVTSLCRKAAAQRKPNLKRECLRSRKVSKRLSKEEIASCFDLSHHLRNIDKIFERFEKPS